ncbi:MAG: hypothetical protein E3J35_05345 [Methanomassiliicoccales archaeon]|nr:MAG: hypothetical protein E3J35_05345 [Methanomassiliicoccales archaeon]
MKIGIMLLDHGEPPEYNEHTYYSFRDFATSLITMGFVPKIVLRFDRGTILQDKNKIYSEEPSPSPTLIDAKLHPYTGKTHYIPKAEKNRITRFGFYRKGTKPHYLARKTGWGYGEPDYYEMYGFEIHDRWSQMGGRSPFYEQSQSQKEEVAKRLKKEYGDKVAVRFAYGIDPFPHKKKQDPMTVVKEFINKDKITHLVVSEHFSVITDSMSTHHLRKHVEHGLHETGKHIPITYADQLGGTEAFNEGVVLKAKEELSELPRNANVAVFLSNHGFPTTKIGKYDASTDCYHRNVKEVYESAKKAILQDVDWGGKLTVQQVFGQFLGEKYNPGQKMMSPTRALDLVSSQGFEYVIDIPYEFPGDSVDVLVKLRNAYGLKKLPDWSEKYETRLKHKGINVKITSASFHPEHWIRSYLQRTMAAIERVANKGSCQHCAE